MSIDARQAAVNTLDLLAMGGKGACGSRWVRGSAHHGYSGPASAHPRHNGVGDVELPHRPGPEAESAADMLVRLAHAHPGELDVIAIGPLHQPGAALKQDPSSRTWCAK